MSAIQPLYYYLGINSDQFLDYELSLFEAELFTKILKELREFYRNQHREYFRTLKFSINMENKMLDTTFARLVTKDILLSEEYDLNGIALYTDTPQDVILEVVDGRNKRPTATYLCRVIELHRSVRRDLYDSIIKKIVTEYLSFSKNIA